QEPPGIVDGGDDARAIDNGRRRTDGVERAGAPMK
ncbi:MAG: hypothetical protein JWM47_104, partial [Acidimicrobiales bacterium]|nr:hypothetical protein [Acidimicrobiales bacterium]